MPASPKPPRTPPKPKRPIRRKTPLKSGGTQARRTSLPRRRARVRPMSDKKRAEIKIRTEVTRPSILLRDVNRCRACLWAGVPSVVRWLEVNEEPPRSLGGDPNDPADCLVLCATIKGDGCHQRRTAGKIKITKGPRGCNAPVTFTEGDRVWQG